MDPITARLELFDGDCAVSPSSCSRFICATFSDSGERLPDTLFGDALHFDSNARDSLQVRVQAMPLSTHCVFLFYRLAKIPRIDRFTLWIDSIEVNEHLVDEESVKSPYALLCGIFARVPPHVSSSGWYFLSKMECIWRKKGFVPEVIYRHEFALITDGVAAAVQNPAVRCVKYENIGVFNVFRPKEPSARLNHLRATLLENFKELVRQAEITANVEKGYIAHAHQTHPTQNPNDAQTPTFGSTRATNDDQRACKLYVGELWKQCRDLEGITHEQQIVIKDLRDAMERMAREKEAIMDQQQNMLAQLQGQVSSTVVEPAVREDDGMIHQLQVASRRAIEEKDAIIARLRQENAMLRQRKPLEFPKHVVETLDSSSRKADSRDGSPMHEDACLVKDCIQLGKGKDPVPAVNRDEVRALNEEETRVYAPGGNVNNVRAGDGCTKDDAPCCRNESQKDTQETDGPLVPLLHLGLLRNYNEPFATYAGNDFPLSPSSEANSHNPPHCALRWPGQQHVLNSDTRTNVPCTDSPQLPCTQGDVDRRASSITADRINGFDEGANLPEIPSPDRLASEITGSALTAERRSSRHGTFYQGEKRVQEVRLESPRGAATSSPACTYGWSSSSDERRESSSTPRKQSPRTLDVVRLVEKRSVLVRDDGQKVESHRGSTEAVETSSTVDSLGESSNVTSDSSREMDVLSSIDVLQGTRIHPSNTLQQTEHRLSNDSSCAVGAIPNADFLHWGIPFSSDLPERNRTSSNGGSEKDSRIHSDGASQGTVENKAVSDFSNAIGSYPTFPVTRETWSRLNSDSSYVIEIFPKSSSPRPMGTPSNSGSLEGLGSHRSCGSHGEMKNHLSSGFPSAKENIPTFSVLQETSPYLNSDWPRMMEMMPNSSPPRPVGTSSSVSLEGSGVHPGSGSQGEMKNHSCGECPAALGSVLSDHAAQETSSCLNHVSSGEIETMPNLRPLRPMGTPSSGVSLESSGVHPSYGHQGEMKNLPGSEFSGSIGCIPSYQAARETSTDPNHVSSCVIETMPNCSPLRPMGTPSSGVSIQGSGVHSDSGTQEIKNDTRSECTHAIGCVPSYHAARKTWSRSHLNNKSLNSDEIMLHRSAPEAVPKKAPSSIGFVESAEISPDSDFLSSTESSLACHSLPGTRPRSNNDSSCTMEIIPISSPLRAMGTPSNDGSVGGTDTHLESGCQMEMIRHPSSDFLSVVGSPKDGPSSDFRSGTWVPPSRDSSRRIEIPSNGDSAPSMKMCPSNDSSRRLEAGLSGELSDRTECPSGSDFPQCWRMHLGRNSSCWMEMHPSIDSIPDVRMHSSSEPSCGTECLPCSDSPQFSLMHSTANSSCRMEVHQSTDLTRDVETHLSSHSSSGMGVHPSAGLLRDVGMQSSSNLSSDIGMYLSIDSTRDVEMDPSSNSSCGVGLQSSTDSAFDMGTHQNSNASCGVGICPSPDASRDVQMYPSWDRTRDLGIHPSSDVPCEAGSCSGSDVSQWSGTHSSGFARRWVGGSSSGDSSYGVALSSRTEASACSSLNDKLANWRHRLITAVNDAESRLL